MTKFYYRVCWGEILGWERVIFWKHEPDKAWITKCLERQKLGSSLNLTLPPICYCALNFYYDFISCILWSLDSYSDQIRSDQSLSRVQLFATPWIAARQASLSITNSRSSLRLTSIESAMPSSHLILCRPLLLLPPIPPSIRVLCKNIVHKWGIWNEMKNYRKGKVEVIDWFKKAGCTALAIVLHCGKRKKYICIHIHMHEGKSRKNMH